MKKLTMAAALAVFAIGATALHAASGERMNHGDANGDGVTTRAEAETQVAAMFARMDANKDGKLDQADRAAHHGQMFDRLDADKNGAISRAEFDAHHARPMGGKGEHKMGAKHRMGGHRMGGGMLLRMADANKDGAVTRDEATAAASKHFAMVDANKDGQITKDERAAARKAMAAKWKDGHGGDDAGEHADHEM